MKLRIKGNTVRLRVDRRDLEALLRDGRVIEETRFGATDDLCFSYMLEIAGAPGATPVIGYRGGRFTIQIGQTTAIDWVQSERVGFESSQQEDGRTIRLTLEKDFACLDRPAGQEGDDEFAFPNPSSHC
ncbi:hypothetical protein Pan44_28400 [Caulifigura coniformis]|uniref:Uncharacterized protein n=1 Tax=Caulifigura coniformis TaxID=2527983 RepID=A0A517SF97_9PLAN|nr:hypothetical protein [Caulifigura coniformis]QDT54802.1 hypothetical protein Pan44_28400 [Caulifigura coniformis]